MSDRHDPPPADAAAEHFARLLAHADELLGEWRDYSDQLRSSLGAQAEEAGARAGREMRKALAEIGPARGGRDGRSTRAPWLVLIAIQIAVGAIVVAAVLMTGGRTGDEQRAAGAGATATPADAGPGPATPDAGIVADAAPPPPPPLCSGLLRGQVEPAGIELIRACAVVACDFEPPARDRGNRALARALSDCQPERDAAVVEALARIARSRKALARCRAIAGGDGSFAVDERFLATCRGEAGK